MDKFSWLVPICILWLGLMKGTTAETFYVKVTIGGPETFLHLVSDKFQEWIPVFGDSNCNQIIQLINTSYSLNTAEGILELQTTSTCTYATYVSSLESVVYSLLMSKPGLVFVNWTEIEILNVNVYQSYEDANQNNFANDLYLCSFNSSYCLPNQRCLDTHFLPVCEDSSTTTTVTSDVVPSSLDDFEDSSDVPDASWPFDISDTMTSSSWHENDMSNRDEMLPSSLPPDYDQSVSPSESTPDLYNMYSDSYFEESNSPYDYYSSQPLQSSYDDYDYYSSQPLQSSYDDQTEESSLPYDYYSSQPLQSSYDDQIEESSLPYDYYSSQPLQSSNDDYDYYSSQPLQSSYADQIEESSLPYDYYSSQPLQSSNDDYDYYSSQPLQSSYDDQIEESSLPYDYYSSQPFQSSYDDQIEESSLPYDYYSSQPFQSSYDDQIEESSLPYDYYSSQPFQSSYEDYDYYSSQPLQSLYDDQTEESSLPYDYYSSQSLQSSYDDHIEESSLPYDYYSSQPLQSSYADQIEESSLPYDYYSSQSLQSSYDDHIEESSLPYDYYSSQPLQSSYADQIEESSLPYDYYSSQPLQSSYADQIEESSLPYDYYSSQSQSYSSQETSYSSLDELYSSQEKSYSSPLELYSSSDEIYSSQDQPYSSSYPTLSIEETLLPSSTFVSTQSTDTVDTSSASSTSTSSTYVSTPSTDLYTDTTTTDTSSTGSTLTSSTYVSTQSTDLYTDTTTTNTSSTSSTLTSSTYDSTHSTDLYNDTTTAYTTTASSSLTSSTTSSTSTKTTTTTTTITATSNKQRALYPYGKTVGDFNIKTRGNEYFYYWYDAISDPIYFPTGVPFGSQSVKVAHVLPNGVITFGKQARVWWPNLLYLTSSSEGNVLAPFWTYSNPYSNGTVYYQLYDKANSTSASVITRATDEVREQYKLNNFNATCVLVATWENVEPESWYYWLCDYYRYWKDYYWWWQYYQYYYDLYCNKAVQTNTFQAVYITDGQTAYAIVTYKQGAMNWVYDQWRTIQVGYAHVDNYMDLGVSYTELTTKMDTTVWNSGRYGTWIEKVGESKNPNSQCYNFYLSNKYLLTDTLHKKRVKDLFECPCILGDVGAQWWYYSWAPLTEGPTWSYVYCFAISPIAKSRLARFQGNPLNKLCCYKYTSPDYTKYWDWEVWYNAWRYAPYIHYRDINAGHLLLNDPWQWWWWWGSNDVRKSREEDFNPHRWCCEESSSPSYYCGLFNQVRPDYGCSWEAEFITGLALGDPHIKTLDGREYALNYLGEKILLKIVEQNFMLQARTKQVVNSKGDKTNATIFIAFAAREGNYSSFQVELDAKELGMIITANGHDCTQDFYKIKDYNETFDNNSISVKRLDKENKTNLIVSFPSTISLNFFVGVKNLEISVDIPKMYKDKTSGLMGNFNDNPDDDFKLENGTILSPNSTERVIYETFGREWDVTTSNTIFTYPLGETALDYQFPEFQPLFEEDIDQNKRSEAESKCGDNHACIYDYVLTGNEQFALNTKNSVNEASLRQTSQSNNKPVLSLVNNQLNSKQRWEVNHGVPSDITFSASDADNDAVTFLLVDVVNSNVTIDSKTGVLTYIPDLNIPLSIGVQAKDAKGDPSTILHLDIVVCPDCSGHGVCDRSRTQEEEKENGRFLLNVCSCWPAYTGNNCENEYDACKDKPCLPGQECFDKTAAEQGNSTIGYICGQCPDGYEERNNYCVDKNECFSNGTESESVCPEHSDCENNVGSYTCTCLPGYRLDPKNSSLCKDVDECAEKTHSCQQVCENTEGGFNCSCLPGNVLAEDRKTCQRDDKNAALCSAKGCNQVCMVVDGVASCGCNTGYTNSSDTLCTDINECALANKPCSQSCQNTDGGFLCSCYPGYKLDEDKVACIECNKPYYGINCSKTCVCNGRGQCNNVRGCECIAGWKGDNCNQDVDECTTNGACLLGQICVNTLGSFKCECPSGFENISGQCQDINECLDVLDNKCDLSTEDCVNNKGSYSCECRTGFSRNKNNICQDIDECTTSSHNCEHVCENTEGKFNCKCFYGFTLDIDRAHCVKRDVDVCAGSNLNCSDICTVDLVTNTSHCSCNSGYSLQGTNTCVDINECDYNSLNLCGEKEKCVNSVGGFTCSCSPGFKLDNDKRTCLACGEGKWGLECSNDCACSTGADRCDPQKGCICKSGFTGTHCEKDLDECTTGLLTCGQGEKCVNTYGSASCQCLDGYTQVSGQCKDIDECSSLLSNKCDQVCQNYVGGYTCSCHTGYKFEPVNKTCLDIDECLLNVDGCEQVCENTNGGYHCSCLNGLKLNVDGVTCSVTKECSTKVCSDKCAVVNNVETCLCPIGKILDSDNTHCIDTDLCKDNPCSDNCTETPDGTRITCGCPTGKKLALDGITCQSCTEGTYGDSCSKTCSCTSANTISCDKVTGQCSCKSGWTGSSCSDDLNECLTTTSCQANAHCVNTPGSYVCKCDLGFYLNNGQCQACTAGTFGEECKNQCQCDMSHSTCSVTSGDCLCKPGWTGTLCDEDLNECDSSNLCTSANKLHWVCKNTPGSYKCDCEAGYENKNDECVDLDECATGYTNECDGNCTNTAGSYTCSCSTGYKLAIDGHTCNDVDECLQGNGGCQQKCVNEVGNFSCSCNAGYSVDDVDRMKCYKSSGYGFQVRISKDVRGLNLREKLGKDYLTLKELLEQILKSIIIKKVPGLRDLIINNLDYGSVVVDFTTVVDTTVTNYAASKMVEAILNIGETGITIDGVLYNATVIVGNIKVPPVQDKCQILNALEACGPDTACDLNSDGEAYCKDTSEDLNIPLIVGLSVGLPLAVACIITVVCCIWYKKKYTSQRRVCEKESTYTERPTTPSTPEERPSTPEERPPSAPILVAWSEKDKLVS